ncbi:MAG: nucleotidyltransferase family protein [Defluviitaleaceae bacterium]|nr:nucleotidyltransferase family protein [Defluviitaleaceae bacterium]
MRTTGIIAEFNPFHKGHAAHINETKAKFGGKIIVAMSGNFVQRGEPAVSDKWRRTKTALAAGADIVLEIPVPYVVAGADFFARGSVGLLAATGVIDALSFGSECGDIGAIRDAARVLADEPHEYRRVLREKLGAGMSFAAARGAALDACIKDAPAGLFTKPNNCLAIEYCKALRLLGDPMEVFTTFRASGGPSATKIREKLHARGGVAHIDDFSEIFRFLIYTRDFDLGEGLENRFRKFSSRHKKISEIIDAVKTKRYTRTRLSRAVLCVILGINAAEIGEVPYIRVLGFRKESADLLGRLTEKAALPVITHGAAMDEISTTMLAKDFEATDIYRIATAAEGFRRERAEGIIVV